MKETTLVIPHSELVNYGCKNCVWRLHGQCPHDLSIDEIFSETITSGVVIKGYCPELADFISSFALPGDSISSVWEKYSIYVSKLQSMTDYKNFMLLDKEITELESGNNSFNPDGIEKLRVKRDSLKMWWSKLNEQVMKSLSKVVTREQQGRMDRSKNTTYINNSGHVNFGKPVDNDKLEHTQ